MKTTLNLTLLVFIFIQTTFSQEVDYKKVTEIVIGEYYTDNDLKIMEEVVNNNKQKVALKLIKTDKYLNETVDVNGKDIVKACSSLYIIKQENKQYINKFYKALTLAKKKDKAGTLTNAQIRELNKNVNKYKELIDKEEEASNNFKMCVMTQRAVKKDYYKVIEKFHTDYLSKKTSITSLEEEED